MISVAASRKIRRGPDTVEILRLRIALYNVTPQVTRTLLIRATSSLSTLHTAIQCAMGWEDSHLHEFEKDGVRYGPVNLYDDFDEMEVKSNRKQLGGLLAKAGDSMTYLYDFGDSWHHLVTLEERLPPDLGLKRPTCVTGENACPPEDVGGPGGYMYYLEAILDPEHEEHTEMIEWRGTGFHPAHFSIEEAEAKLERVFR